MDQEPGIHKWQRNECISLVYKLTLVPDFSSSFNIGPVSLDNYANVTERYDQNCKASKKYRVFLIKDSILS